MPSPVRNCPHCGAVLPLPDDLSRLKLACPYCKREYLVTDVVAPELVAAQHVSAGVERTLTAHTSSQRRLLLGFGAAMLVLIGAAVLLLRGSPTAAPVPAPVAAPTVPAPPSPSPAPPEPVASAARSETEPGWRVVSQFGGEGTGPGKFDRAHNLALDAAGNVFVVDRSNRVQKFDGQGKLLGSFLAETKRQPRGPLSTDVEYALGIAVDAAGKIYVSLGYDIQVFSAGGKLERTVVGGQNCYRELSFDQSQNLYARAHCSDEHDNALVKLSRSGAILQRIPEPRTFERAATGKLAVDGAGKLYVPHGYEFQIHVLDARGNNLDRIGQRGDAPGEFSTTFLSALAFDTRGTLYALCGGDISLFEAGGRFLSRVEPRVADRSIDLAPAPDGTLWILTGEQLVKRLALVK